VIAVDYDVIVIGGGAGGMGAARAAAWRGARALLVQQGPIGGDCTFTGCVPSKALIEAAGRGASFREAISAARQAIEIIAATEGDDVFSRQGIDVLHGWARFRSRREIDVDGRRLSARSFIIATGAGPAVPPVEGLDRVPYLTNETVFGLERAPRSLVVLGGGAVGCELAQAFARLGVNVVIVEALPRILSREESETSEAIATVFRTEGIGVRTGATVTKAEALAGGDVRLRLGQGEPVVAERLLVAVGREPATAELGLDLAGVATERAFVNVDARLATTAPGIWAVGDVTGLAPFTHAADEMGRIAVGNAVSRAPKRKFNTAWIPAVTFTRPEVARVGMTEEEAAEHGGQVAYVPMTEVDRAVTAQQTTGFVKLIAGPRPVFRNAGGGRVLGATVVAERAGEMIHEAVLAMRTRMFTGRLAQTVHAYPTWSAAMRKAAGQFFVEVDGRRARPARRD
jgi:pyruvate/2-oxoglutarate dehydrogenase complex dihydrolipoamide dehydrogenase (E3) component